MVAAPAVSQTAEPTSRAPQAPTGRGAAFFDLDKTLIEGSSAIHFGRAAYRQGLLTKRRLARDAWANVRFRLRGSTDEETDALRGGSSRRSPATASSTSRG